MEIVVVVATAGTGMAIALGASRLVLEGILSATFRKFLSRNAPDGSRQKLI